MQYRVQFHLQFPSVYTVYWRNHVSATIPIQQDTSVYNDVVLCVYRSYG